MMSCFCQMCSDFKSCRVFQPLVSLQKWNGLLHFFIIVIFVSLCCLHASEELDIIYVSIKCFGIKVTERGNVNDQSAIKKKLEPNLNFLLLFKFPPDFLFKTHFRKERCSRLNLRSAPAEQNDGVSVWDQSAWKRGRGEGAENHHGTRVLL